jgi:hypothetical protein
MNPHEYLTHEERIRRIGQLLSEGITPLLEETEECRREIPSVDCQNAPKMGDEMRIVSEKELVAMV